MKRQTIYHIVTADDLKACTKRNHYQPANFEEDFFIHCTGEKETSLDVLRDYFSQVDKNTDILILEIETNELEAEVKFEDPAPIEGGGTSHIKEGLLFPHIYGPLNIDAVSGAGKVGRDGSDFQWPSSFSGIDDFL